MNAKQQAIKKAYGEYWEQVKDYVNDDGWVWDGSIHYHTIFKEDNVLDFKRGSYEELLFRPKPLQGIETNNGWIELKGIIVLIILLLPMT